MSCTGRGENSEENDRGGVLQEQDILNIGKEACVRERREIQKYEFKVSNLAAILQTCEREEDTLFKDSKLVTTDITRRGEVILWIYRK